MIEPLCLVKKYCLTKLFFFSGTVVTGRVTRGKLKVGIDVDILGYDKFFKGKVNGKRNFLLMWNVFLNVINPPFLPLHL